MPGSLTIVTRTQGNNRALTAGLVRPRTVHLEFVDVPVLVDGFRRMVRGLEFDVCEMALTTYLCAREHGVAFTALPVFLVRGFHHGAIVVRQGSAVSPGRLAGRRVGVNRGYTVTTGVWARGILQQEYGVDLSAVEWVLSGDEHVAQYRPPGNVSPTPAGRALGELIDVGELAAAIGIKADGRPTLIPDAEQAGYAALQARGHYPINHLVVVRNDVLAARPELAADLFEAFRAAKSAYVDDLRSGAIAAPTAVDRMHARVMEITGGDPLPYGIEPNRAMLDELIGHAISQRILTARPRLESLFAAGTTDLEG